MDADLIETDDSRILKRTRQACDPCRRKKSKCSGEKPICATCYRLRTRCTYGIEPMRYAPYTHETGISRQINVHSSGSEKVDNEATSSEPQQTWHDRIESLESTLAEVLQELRVQREIREIPTLSPDSRRYHGRQKEDSISSRFSESSQHVGISTIQTNESRLTGAVGNELTGLGWDSAIIIAEAYLTFCDCQPLPLFHRETFISSFPNRELEVVYSVVALASRFTNFLPEVDPILDINRYTDAAHQRVMSQITSGKIELSTLQTLCLLALIEFNKGETPQSGIHSSLAMTLAKHAQLHHEPAFPQDEWQIEERRRCYWSIILLRRLLGEESEKPVPSPLGPHIPRIPPSPRFPPTESVTEEGQYVAKSQPTDEESGILYVVVKLSEVWYQAQKFINGRGASNSEMDPWDLNSAYSTAMESAMKLDKQLPSIHRYRFIRLSTLTTAELDKSRDYWGPWFLSRLLYHTSVCIINHPIIIMFQLQGRRHISELFLQQTTFQRNHHTSWVLHFIDFMSSRRFFISDPLFAYCAAVIATIELHQSFVEENTAQKERRRQSYQACLGLVSRLATTWPSLKHAINKLNSLEQHMIASYESNYAKNDGKICVDVSIFFSILDLPKFYTPKNSEGVKGSIFGESLKFKSTTIPSQRAYAKLPVLPPITEMHSSSELQQPGDSLSHNEFSQFSMSDNHMMFPADQFFGGFLCPDVNPWEPIMDIAGSDESPRE